MADEFEVSQSLSGQGDDILMQNRTFTWIPDSNGGSYSGGGQVVLNCEGIANSGKYLSCNNSYIQISLVMTLATTAGNCRSVVNFSLSAAQASFHSPAEPKSPVSNPSSQYFFAKS